MQLTIFLFDCPNHMISHFLQLSLKAQDFADLLNFSDKSAIFFRLLAITILKTLSLGSHSEMSIYLCSRPDKKDKLLNYPLG